LVVTGVLGDKDVDKILRHFCEITNDFIATEPDSPRKLPAFNMAEKLTAAGKNCIAALDLGSVCERALELSEDYDVILFTGSLYLLGEVRRSFR